MDAHEPAPGDTWRSTGSAGHHAYEVRVVKRTAGGKVVFTSFPPSSKRMQNRLHTVALEKFLSQHRYVRSADD
jgi:hypothetical protein